MAFLEWRRFTFFDTHNNADGGKIAECLQDTNVTVSTSGNSHVVLCDETGWAHLISRSWDITSFKAYEISVTLAQQFQHDPYLVTIGNDEAGINPLIRVWDWSRSDRHGNPVCVRTSKAIPTHSRPTNATALAVHDNKKLLAVGYQDGSVSLYHGDVTRQRGKMNTLAGTGTNPITMIAFKGSDKLFIVSRVCVMIHQVGSDRVTTLDSMGCAPLCGALDHRRHLMLATKEAIYCYTDQGRGPCYALAGEKVRLNWFRSYLVITTNETPTQTASTSRENPKSHHITILDIQNKFIVFSKTFEELDAVLTEWGSFYILTKNKELIYLDEKDLQSKLSLLFKKNLYDVAIRMASSQHYDATGLTEIYKQYGDHLYGKGDLKGAIEQYVKTIGWLETSYVIRKYLESRHLEPLVVYLEELHKKGHATEDHTTLLLTCYVKIDQHDQQGKLKQFINAKDKLIEFDVDVAIKVVRHVSPSDALTLAAMYNRHDDYLRILLEDQKQYAEALRYIADLQLEDAEVYIKKYGHALVEHVPAETTEFLKLLCTDYKPRSQPLVDESTLTGGYREPARANADDFIHLFLNDSKRLIEFLEHLLKGHTKCSKLVYNSLLEHYVNVWARSDLASDRSEYEKKIMNIMRDPEADYDRDQMLIICQLYGFKTGTMHIYEEKKLLRLQVTDKCGRASGPGWDAMMRRGESCPRLYRDALWTHPDTQLLPHVLHCVRKENVLSPTQVVDCLADAQKYTLGDVKKYLMDVFKEENEVIIREQELANKYRSETSKMMEEINALQHEPLTFQSSKCAACSRQLELPTRTFLCTHAFHLHCFQSYSECEGECPACPAAPRAPPANAETLHDRVHHQPDHYAVVSEYFGRGLFNKITLVADGPVEVPPQVHPSLESQPPVPTATPTPSVTATRNYGPGAEAKLRQLEGQSKQVYVPPSVKQLPTRSTAIIPVPEGRMRVIEQQQYSSSLEANLSKLPEVHTSYLSSIIPAKKPEQAMSVSPKISSALANNPDASNPFDDPYDDAKNPFAEDDSNNDPNNPFSDPIDDYDKNLNPFA